MALQPLPAKADISSGYPVPNNTTARTGFAAMWEFLNSVLGATGSKASMLAASKILDSAAFYNLSLVPSVAANALTMTVKSADGATSLAVDNAGTVVQRDILANGKVSSYNITADFSTTISSGSTAGRVNNQTGYLYWYIISNAGVQELAWSTKDYGESGIMTTTAEGGAGAADSATTVYSTTARTNAPFRLFARTTDTQTVAGAWLGVPSTIEMAPFRAGQPATIQVFTASGGAIWNKPAGMRAAIVISTAGGAGGAGADSTGANAACGSGGDSGATVIEYFRTDQLLNSENLSVGVGGGGGGVGAAGSAGGNTTFGTTPYHTASGGAASPAPLAAGTTAAMSNLTGTGGAAATGGLINIRGGVGTVGIRFSGTLALGGNGAPSFWGSGAVGQAGPGNGMTSSTIGTGGAGATAAGGTDGSGGNGCTGICIVIELYD